MKLALFLALMFAAIAAYAIHVAALSTPTPLIEQVGQSLLAVWR